MVAKRRLSGRALCMDRVGGGRGRMKKRNGMCLCVDGMAADSGERKHIPAAVTSAPTTKIDHSPSSPFVRHTTKKSSEKGHAYA